MAYEIVIGRSAVDKEKFGLKGTIFLGKHYVKMGQTTSLSSDILLDVNRSHVVFVCGKRGSGKSYTLGVIAEGIVGLEPEISKNLSVLIFDTMGIFWTMKYPNQKDMELLKEWGLQGKGLGVRIYTPVGFYDEFKKKGIPTDFPFSIKPSELAPSDWCMTFEIDINSPPGVLIERIINKLKKTKKSFSIEDVITAVQNDKRSEQDVKDVVENQFLKTEGWGLFSEKATPIDELAAPGKATILDISCYATVPGTWGIRALVIGIISQKLFMGRMTARKAEEFEAIHKSTHLFAEEEGPKEKMPMVWLFLDEAHEFLPRKGRTDATDALVTILREGREPGISLVLASQQPGKIHTDVMTQADTVLSHRLTAKIDVEALGLLMQSYLRKGLDVELNQLPRVTGAGIIFDDMNEKLYPMRVRPRFTWHGGAAPVAVREEKKKEFEL
jgi:energy-coupling factor transporter ATP-binding protein EcfA2